MWRAVFFLGRRLGGGRVDPGCYVDGSDFLCAVCRFSVWIPSLWKFCSIVFSICCGVVCLRAAICLIVAVMSWPGSLSVSVRIRSAGIEGSDLAPDVSGVANVFWENEKYVFGSLSSCAVVSGFPLYAWNMAGRVYLVLRIVRIMSVYCLTQWMMMGLFSRWASMTCASNIFSCSSFGVSEFLSSPHSPIA